MKIILLGANGQLGKEWQHFFRQQNQEIKVTSYNSRELDITNYDKVADEIENQQPEVVINCAAYTSVDTAEKEKEKAIKVNAGAVEQLAKTCVEVGCKLVHYSTDYVFPGTKEDKENNHGGYAEEHPAHPINWYGKSKWEGEEAIRHTCSNYLIVRVAWLCGQFGSNFVTTMLKAGKERDRLSVVNDQWGSPSYAENVVKNTFALLKAGKKGTFHVTSNGLITWYDLADAIFRLKNIEVELNAVTSDEYPTEANRPFFSKLSTRKIQSVPGVLLEDWKTGLKKLLDRLENR